MFALVSLAAAQGPFTHFIEFGDGAIEAPHLVGAPRHFDDSETLRFSGWAVDGEHSAPAAYAEILIDNQAHRVVYGQPRPDVANLYKDARATNVGFELNLALRSLSAGQHSVSLLVHSKFSPKIIEIGKATFYVDKTAASFAHYLEFGNGVIEQPGGLTGSAPLHLG